MEPVGPRFGIEERAAALRELGRPESTDVLAVDEAELLRIEERGGVVHIGDVEHRWQLAQRIEADLRTVGQPPAEQGQVVDHRLRQEPSVAVVEERHVVASLRELLALLVDDEGQVAELDRPVIAERAAQQQLLGRHVQQVLTPDDVRDVHLAVIDRVRDEERRRTVCAAQDEVLDGGVVEGDLPADQIGPRRRPVIGSAEAHRPTVTRSEVTVPVGRVVGPATGPLAVALRHRVRPVGETGIEQAVHRCMMRIAPGRLEHRGLVPVEPHPLERLEDDVDELLSRTFQIGVLDTKEEDPAEVAGGEPVEQRRPGAAQVQVARRSRSESDSDARGAVGLGARHVAPRYRLRPGRRHTSEEIHAPPGRGPIPGRRSARAAAPRL